MRSEEGINKWKERNKRCQERHRAKLKLDALFHCSDGKLACVICGNKKLEELCIKHKGGGGWKHREKIGVVGGESGTKLYRWLRDNKWPKDFRTACRNCNFQQIEIAKMTRKEAKEKGISDRAYYRATAKYKQKT